MLRNIIFSLDFCYFKDISDKVTADDEIIMHDNVTCMMTSCLIHCVDYYLYFFVTEMQYISQNFKILWYYFHFIVQQLMKMNIFLCKRSLFRETAKKTIFLNYNVINDAMHLMMQCIYQ